jgi:hypothetical protein
VHRSANKERSITDVCQRPHCYISPQYIAALETSRRLCEYTLLLGHHVTILLPHNNEHTSCSTCVVSIYYTALMTLYRIRNLSMFVCRLAALCWSVVHSDRLSKVCSRWTKADVGRECSSMTEAMSLTLSLNVRWGRRKNRPTSTLDVSCCESGSVSRSLNSYGGRAGGIRGSAVMSVTSPIDIAMYRMCMACRRRWWHRCDCSLVGLYDDD